MLGDRTRWLALPVLTLLFLLAPPTAEATVYFGCYNCVEDGGWGPAGPTNYVCEQAGNEETGEGIQCVEWEVWMGTLCNATGGQCFNVEVEEPWPPQPD